MVRAALQANAELGVSAEPTYYVVTELLLDWHSERGSIRVLDFEYVCCMVISAEKVGKRTVPR